MHGPGMRSMASVDRRSPEWPLSARSSPPSRSSRSPCSAAATATRSRPSSRTPASSCPATPCRSAAGKIGTIDDIELDDSAQAVVTLKVDDDFAPPARGHHGDDPGHLAVGHREPLRLAPARPEQRRARSTTAGRSAPTTPSAPVDIDTLFNTLDDAHARGPPQRHPGLRRPVRRQGRAGQRGHQVLQPVPGEHQRPHARARARPEGPRALRDRHLRRRDGDRGAPRRPRRPRDATRTPPSGRSATRTRRSTARSSSCPTRCARRTRRS